LKKLAIFVLILLASSLAGCASHEVKHGYAKLFSVEKKSSYTILRDSAGRKIVLFRNKKPDIKGDLFIKVPVKRVVVLSTGIVSYLEALNSTSTLVGVPSVSKWYYKDISDGLKKGRIKEVGKVNDPDYEEILALKPDVVFIPANFVSSGVVKKLESLGVPCVSCGYWLEKTPLGKLEWIKFFGYFFGRENAADMYFKSAKNRILSVEQKVKGLKKVKAVYALILNGKVLVPGNQSYHAKLIYMAGGDYAFSNLNSTGYVPVSEEQLIEKTENADVFIAIYMGYPIKSVNDIVKQIPALAKTKPFRDSKVYAMQPWIWQYSCEEDKVIEDIAAILHPDAFHHRLVMFRKLS